MSNTSKSLFLMISCLLLPAAAVAQQGLGFGQFHGTSPAIKDLKPSQPQETSQQIKPWFRPYGAPVGPAPAAPNDRVLQPSVTTPLSVTVGKNILGLGSGFSGFTASYAPPDTNAAVGTTQVVEAVNLSFAVFNKTSGALPPRVRRHDCCSAAIVPQSNERRMCRPVTGAAFRRVHHSPAAISGYC